MSWIPKDLYYPLLFGLMWIMALVLIPKDKYKTLLFYGLVWGLFCSYLFIWILASWLHLFEYLQAEPFKTLGINLWLGCAWIPAIMLFLYYLPLEKSWYALPLYLVIFALASASIEEVFHEAGLLKYHFWNPWFRFGTSLVWFWSAYKHYQVEQKSSNRLSG